jgi:hypothetical protein
MNASGWQISPAQHRLQRTAASPLAGTRREPAKLGLSEGVLPVPPLPLKPTVGRNCPLTLAEDSFGG